MVCLFFLGGGGVIVYSSVIFGIFKQTNDKINK